MTNVKDMDVLAIGCAISKEKTFMDVHNPQDQKEILIHPSVIEQHLCYGLPIKIDDTLPPNTIDVVLRK